MRGTLGKLGEDVMRIVGCWWFVVLALFGLAFDQAATAKQLLEARSEDYRRYSGQLQPGVTLSVRVKRCFGLVRSVLVCAQVRFAVDSMNR